MTTVRAPMSDVLAACNDNLDDPRVVARLLQALREVGAADQAAGLLARDPAAHANLGDPRAVASLLDALRKVIWASYRLIISTEAVAPTARKWAGACRCGG
jgi:hypothetical protein